MALQKGPEAVEWMLQIYTSQDEKCELVADRTPEILRAGTRIRETRSVAVHPAVCEYGLGVAGVVVVAAAGAASLAAVACTERKN